MPSSFATGRHRLAQQVEVLARRVRAVVLQRQRELRAEALAARELVLRREDVVEADDAQAREPHVVAVRVALRVREAERLVDVVVEVGAGADDDIDQPVLDQVDDKRPHAGRHHRAGEAEEDRRLVAQHRLPDLRGDAEVARLEGRVAHALDEIGRGGAYR